MTSNTDESTTVPGPDPDAVAVEAPASHSGVVMTGRDGADGPKAFYIHIEARPGRQDEVVRMLRDILGFVEQEPATGPWYGVRYSDTVFGIFEVFPGIAGRRAHVEGGGGDIFRDVERMNHLLVRPAHVCKLDVVMSKEVFASAATQPSTA